MSPPRGTRSSGRGAGQKAKVGRGSKANARKKDAGSRGEASGSSGKASRSAGRGSGSAGKGPGSAGKASGSAGKGPGSAGKASRSAGKGPGSAGKTSGLPGRSSGSTDKAATKRMSSRGVSSVSATKGPPSRGNRSNARVVWPPSERTETAREAIEQLMLKAGLAREFDADVEREASEAATHAWQVDGRRDLRELPTFTIDPATARDFDDAISAETLTDGAIRVWVHIADVAAHVPAGSLVDLEARNRATSVYVPGAVDPMLPHVLSSDACSLVPGVDRLAVTAELVLRGAEMLSASFLRSIVCSDMRLDYEQVDRIFAGTDPVREPWGKPLAAARAAAAALQEARERSGALVIDSSEPEFSFDDDGNVSDIRPRPQTESHRLVEHLMIAANEAVARQLTQASIPCLYRVHERPDPQRIGRLVEQLASLGVSTPPLPNPMFSAQAAELVGEISKRVDAHIRRTGQGRMALSSLVLRSLKQACYSPKNLGHSGLDSPCYCHFTSPIRRYPDLLCHRALLASIGANEQATGRRKLVELGEWTSERERDAAKIEHKADDIAACFLLEQTLLEGGFEQRFRGEITGLIAAGAFVGFASTTTGDTQGSIYEGMLPVRLLSMGEERDWWELNEQNTIMRAKRSGATLRLGDPIEVRVIRVDPSAGRVDLAPAG